MVFEGEGEVGSERGAGRLMLIEFELEGRIPAKKNNRKNLPSGISIPSKDYNLWHKDAKSQIIPQIEELTQQGLILPIDYCEEIKLILFYGDRKAADNGNKSESVHDLLVDVDFLYDDRWLVTGPTNQKPVYKKGYYGCRVMIFTGYNYEINSAAFQDYMRKLKKRDNKIKSLFKKKKYYSLVKYFINDLTQIQLQYIVNAIPDYMSKNYPTLTKQLMK